jgi:carbamoyltransferase
LVIDGLVIAFGEEERFSRRKHAVQQPPHHAVAFCLQQAGLTIHDVDVVAVGWDVPKLMVQDGRGSRQFNEREYLEYVLGLRSPSAVRPKVVFVPHHLAHATCGYFASPYQEAAVLVVDGIGESESVSVYVASAEGRLKHLRSWPAASSLGLLYDASCKFVGLSSLEAGKLMGLAAYGRARGVKAWKLAEFLQDEYRLAIPFETGTSHEDVLTRWLHVLTARSGGGEIRTNRKAMDSDELAVQAAWSAQYCVEQAVQWLCATGRRLAGRDELCLVGGVALNCAANGLISEPVFVPPVPHDSGVALGAAWHVSPPTGERKAMSPYLGLDITSKGWSNSLTTSGVTCRPLNEELVIERLLSGKVGGIVDGRAEIGPRALGHRSIVTLPRPAERRDQVNRIKSREPWRPFAPVGLAECNGQLWDERQHLFRYMIGASIVTAKGAEVIPGAMHVDGTARPQVATEDLGLVGRLLVELRRDGVHPVLLNTSFNGPDEPIVNTPTEALATFTRLGLDFVVIGDYMIANDW